MRRSTLAIVLARLIRHTDVSVALSIRAPIFTMSLGIAYQLVGTEFLWTTTLGAIVILKIYNDQLVIQRKSQFQN